MNTAYNIRKNKTLTSLADLTSIIQMNSTFVSDFKISKQVNLSADWVTSYCLEEYTITIKLLLPNVVDEIK